MSATVALLELERPHEQATNESPPTSTCIPKCSASAITYNAFYWNHMKANLPIVLTHISDEWECRQQWAVNNNECATEQHHNSSSGTGYAAINFNYLKQKIGNINVPVANCTKEYFNSHAKCEMLFHDYLNYWERKCAQEKQQTSTCDSECLYLKDWHLKAQMPEYEFYNVPMFFASDWLNEYLLDNKKDDYRFVYMGPKDSWTPLHADVFGSFSWSTNIIGCKRWILLPPGEEQRLKDALGNLPLHIEVDQLQQQQIRHFVVNQMENESLFVPSGWYHQVHNVTDTISVNHNWYNACNVQQVWQNLCAAMQQVMHEICDCRQMENFNEHCQTMLRATFGMNFADFLTTLRHIAKKRISQCQMIQNNNNNNNIVEAKDRLGLGQYQPNLCHSLYDLQAIEQVMHEMQQSCLLVDNAANLKASCMQLLQEVEAFLQKRMKQQEKS